MKYKNERQSRILKFKVLNRSTIEPNLLLTLLATLAKSQIFTQRFTQDIIGTLGAR